VPVATPQIDAASGARAAGRTVHVLTGFLGSGKTTLLNRLLCEPSLRDTAVVVNEFGEVPLDHLLVRGVAGEMIVLANGCICCKVRTDLAEALVEMLDRADRGLIPDFRRVIIETTGLADPVPILGTLEHHPVVRHHVHPGLVVATVDAMHAFTTTQGATEEIHQVSAADWIVLTKTDLVPAERQNSVADEVRSLNPLAQLLIGTEAAADCVLKAMAEFVPSAPAAAQGALSWRGAHAATEHTHGRIDSISITLDQPIDLLAFGVWLSALLHAHGERVLRLKGILNVGDSARPVFVNAVRRMLHQPLHLDAWPDEDRRSRLVFIVDGLDTRLIRRSLERWLAR
jgi:G3E family GTPase